MSGLVDPYGRPLTPGDPSGSIRYWHDRLGREQWHRVGADRWMRDRKPPISTEEAIAMSTREAAARARRKRDKIAAEAPMRAEQAKRDAAMREAGLMPGALYVDPSELGMKGSKPIAIGGRITPDYGRADKVASDYTDVQKTKERGAPTEAQRAQWPEPEE